LHGLGPTESTSEPDEIECFAPAIYAGVAEIGHHGNDVDFDGRGDRSPVRFSILLKVTYINETMRLHCKSRQTLNRPSLSVTVDSVRHPWEREVEVLGGHATATDKGRPILSEPLSVTESVHNRVRADILTGTLRPAAHGADGKDASQT